MKNNKKEKVGDLCQRHIRMFWFNAYTVQLRNGLHRFYDYAIKRNC